MILFRLEFFIDQYYKNFQQVLIDDSRLVNIQQLLNAIKLVLNYLIIILH